MSPSASSGRHRDLIPRGRHPSHNLDRQFEPLALRVGSYVPEPPRKNDAGAAICCLTRGARAHHQLGQPAGAGTAKSQATVVAAFTDANPNRTDTDYDATINWGDSSAVAPGVIASVRGGVWSVTGGPHTDNGSRTSYSITITINHDGLQALTMTATLKIR